MTRQEMAASIISRAQRCNRPIAALIHGSGRRQVKYLPVESISDDNAGQVIGVYDFEIDPIELDATLEMMGVE